MKVIIKKLLRESLNKLSEAEYNYHVSGSDKQIDQTPKPYYSDNITTMEGRGTGHFGSGMYFSTYNCQEKADYDKNYGDGSEFEYGRGKRYPELISVEDKVYRVDFDLYKNLYRITSNDHGDFLFKTLKLVNSVFYTYFHRYDNEIKLNENFKRSFLIIKNNLNKIGLDLPKYKEFITILTDSKKDLINYDKPNSNAKGASASTRIMEWNGYNGVNASGIPGYDNTLHGSVIYDLSKVDTQPKEIKKPNLFCKIENGVVRDTISDHPKYNILKNKELNSLSYKELDNLPDNELLTYMKMYRYFIPEYYLTNLSKRVVDLYLKTLPYKLKTGKMEGEPSMLEIKYLVESNNINLIYNENKIINNNTFIFFILDQSINSRFDEDYLLNIVKNINRELTEDEQWMYDEKKEYWG